MAGLSPSGQAALRAKLIPLIRHRQAIQRFPTPGHLSQFHRPEFIQTPMLDILDDAIAMADRGEAGRIIVNCPPQEGKTSRLQDGCAWMLLRNPRRRIVFASYEQSIAAQSSLEIRRLIETHGGGYRGQQLGLDHKDVLGLRLDPDRAQQTAWSLADVPGYKSARAGSVVAVGVGSSLSGRPADIIVIDDPIKDAKQADSATWRKSVTDWYQSVVIARLPPKSVIIVVQCMTGDTPVLMADGTERALRDVRPGDAVATFEDGKLAVSVVRNWANQGPDTIYAIKMKSGRVVRANARHPFLAIENGEHVWRRTKSLRPGSIIQTVTGASTEGSLAQPKDAELPQSARACAPPITTNSGGPRAYVRPQSIRPAGALPTSSTDTTSPWSSTTPCSPSKMAAAPSAANFPHPETLAPTGMGSSASITTTPPDAFADSCATTAISLLATASRPPSCGLPLHTWNPEADEVLEVVPCGTEDVFDIQVDRTENFIANGLVSHNTRWHEEDLTGWLLTEDAKLLQSKWMHINVPAQADSEDDLLDREIGEYMVSTRGRSIADWEDKKREVGTRWWFAQYQGAPSAPEGGTFKREWFDKYRVDEAPPLTYAVTVIDPADNTGGGDEAGIITGGIGDDGDWYLLEDNSGTYTIGEWVRQALFAMLRNKAGKLCYEQSLSRLQKSIRLEWKKIRLQALALARTREDWRTARQKDWPETPIAPAIQAAAAVLATELDDLDDLSEMNRQLLELWPWVPDILRLPETGPPIQKIIAEGSKSVRAELASPFWESGKVRMVGQFPVLEKQMCTWLPTQDSPDRMDAAVHWANKMSELGVSSLSKAPKTQTVPQRAPVMPINLRSTRRGR